MNGSIDILDAISTATEPTEGAPPLTDTPQPESAEMATGEPEGESQQAPEGEAQAEPESEAEKPQEPQKPQEEDLFSEEALATPEGVKRAAEHLRQEKAKTSEVFLRMRKREQKAKAEYAEFQRQKAETQQEKEAFAAFNQRIAAEIAELKSGNPKAILDTLGRMSGQDGRKLFEDIAMAIATNGKMPKPSKEVEELRAEIQALKEERERERELALKLKEQEEAKAKIEQRKAELVQLGSDKARFPAVAHFIEVGQKKEVAEYLSELKIEAFEQGSPLSDEEAVQKLERLLKPHLPAPPVNEGGTGNPHPAQQGKPGAGGLPGQTVTSRLAAESSGSTRELTEEEYRRALEQDEEFWSSLGL